jgi:bifunctional DNA-binding transcriptional regulator/antitoxin component of YhaV-PrlF toxin-antitoxin module
VSIKTRLRSKSQLTLPAAIASALRVHEGDEIEFLVGESGTVELRGRRSVPTDQAWFWTPEWQAMEREADEAIAAGDVTRYDNAEGFLDSLG